MSMRRYWPPIGTAGFERLSVSGNRRVPRPPPKMIASTSSMDGRFISSPGGRSHAHHDGDLVLVVRELLDPRECWAQSGEKLRQRVEHAVAGTTLEFHGDHQ